jgi:hypothetical protein
MYHLSTKNLLPQILEEGIKMSEKDILPRIYLTDDRQWILKMAEFFTGLNKDIPKEELIIIELDIPEISTNPDDIPVDFLPKQWDQSTKNEYPHHCFFTSEDIPISRIIKIYDLYGKHLVSPLQ